MSDSINCYLEKKFKDDNDNIQTKVMYLSEVQAIEDDISVDLTETPIIVYPASQRFIIDLGTSRKFNVKISRSNPFPYDDSSLDQTQWSNGHWYNEFRNFIDEWQNFNVDSEGNMAGGFLFSFIVPDDAKDLYPDIPSTRVMVSGSIQPTFSVGKLMMTIPLQVANKVSEEESGTEITITLKSGIAGIPDTAIRAYANVIFRAPEPPMSWVESVKDQVFENWSLTQGQLGTIYPGDIISFSEDTTLYAYWNDMLGRAWMNYVTYDIDTEGIRVDYGGMHGKWVVYPPNGCTRIKAYVLGAGGGAGAWSTRIIGSFNPMATYFLGSGGGSGELKIRSFNVFPGETISVEVGSGGRGGLPGGESNGGNGGSTKVSSKSTVIESQGGFGGRCGSKGGVAGGAKGGAYGGAGGASGFEDSKGDLTDGKRGECGEYPGSELVIEGIPGMGSPARVYDKTNKSCGGGGGAANGIVYNYDEAAEPVVFRSIGGHSLNQNPGTEYNPGYVETTNGSVGGGGGAISGSKECMEKGGRGGDGLVIMEFS